MNTRSAPDAHGLTSDQIKRLVAIVRGEAGDGLTRADFNERLLLLFEDVAGFETLPQQRRRQHLGTLWQSYESARRAPE
jgi:hypothetical protein